MNVTHKRRLEQGLCAICGVKPLENKWSCKECVAKGCEAAKRKKQQLLEKGLCAACGVKPLENRSRCRECTAKEAEKSRSRKERLLKQGLCTSCGIKPLKTRVYCEECWLKRVASGQRQDGRKGITYEKIRLVWARQNGLCFYSGGQLNIGENASIDHKVPVAKGGTDDIDNLCFVHRNINAAKLDLDHDEFLAMCRVVAERFPKEERANNDQDDLQATG